MTASGWCQFETESICFHNKAPKLKNRAELLRTASYRIAIKCNKTSLYSLFDNSADCRLDSI